MELDAAGLEQKIGAVEREIQDINGQIAVHNLAIRDLEEGKATAVKRIKELQADLNEARGG